MPGSPSGWKDPREAGQGTSHTCHCCAQPGGELGGGAQANPRSAIQAAKLEMPLTLTVSQG